MFLRQSPHCELSQRKLDVGVLSINCSLAHTSSTAQHHTERTIKQTAYIDVDARDATAVPTADIVLSLTMTYDAAAENNLLAIFAAPREVRALFMTLHTNVLQRSSQHLPG